MKHLLPLLLFLCSSLCWSQSGHTSIIGDVDATRMVQLHTDLNNRAKTIPGFRVQIAAFSGTNSKTSAFNLRDRFQLDYPTVQAYIVFEEPNFKVKVGDFRTRLEAHAFLQEIKETYKGYIIRDNINPEPPQQELYAPDDEQSGDE